MSWYTGTKDWPKGINSNNEVKMTLKLIGSFTQEDENNLREGLLRLEGVKEVNLNINTNRLQITFQPEKMDVAFISYKVGQLGYRYVKRT